VLCFGEALVDRLGPLGGDPATDLPVDDRLGGAPANVACGLARLGTKTAFIGRLGRDEIGEGTSFSGPHPFRAKHGKGEAFFGRKQYVE
jgi:fructokinase